MPAWPTPEEEAELLRRLLDRQATSTVDLFVAFFEPLIEWLASIHRHTDESQRSDAATDAIASLLKSPESYKPERGKSLGSYLKTASTGDLKNLLDKERRRAARMNSGMDVALLADRGKEIGTEMERRDEAERLEANVLAIVKNGLTPEELAGLELLLDGEKRTEAFAVALKLDHLPAAEREAGVKRFKDKIKLRIKRAREVHDEST